MKKLLIISALLLIAGFGQAQIQLGIHADGISTNQTSKYNGTSTSIGSRFSWKAGMIANVGLVKQISFMPQLNLVSKGSKYEGSSSGGSFNQETQLTYVEVPLNFVYNKYGFFAGLGPVLSYGIGGKQTTNDGGETRSSDVKFDGKTPIVFDGNTHLKAFELGGNIIAGYKFADKFLVSASFNLGLSNINPFAGNTLKSNYFGFGVGYFFIRK